MSGPPQGRPERTDMSGPQDSQSPGLAIAAARRARGLSVEDLAERTKIPAAMLVAIEADEFHRLSGPLYARSFLRSCAKELGLAAEDVLELYARHAGEPPRTPHEVPGAPEVVRIRRVGLPWGRLAGGAGAVLVIAVIALVVTRGGGDAPTAAAGRKGGAAAGAGMLAGATVAAPGAAPATRDAAPPTAVAAADSQVAPIATAARRDGPAPAGVPGLVFAGGATWPVVVRLTAAFPVSVRARRDGEAEYAGVAWTDTAGAGPVPVEGIVAGQAYAVGDGLVVYWGAVDRVSLLLGSTDGVEVTVNGRPQVLRLPGPGDELRLELRAAPTTLP